MGMTRQRNAPKISVGGFYNGHEGQASCVILTKSLSSSGPSFHPWNTEELPLEFLRPSSALRTYESLNFQQLWVLPLRSVTRQSWLQNNWVLFSVVEGLFPLGSWRWEGLQTSYFSNRIAVVCSDNKYKVHIDYLPWCVLRKRPKDIPQWGPRMYPRPDPSPGKPVITGAVAVLQKKKQ